MDPFLEHPQYFPGVHDRLITYLSEALQGTLPKPYFAEINERLWVDTVERPIGPDVDVLRGSQPSPPEGGGGVAVATAAPPAQPIIITIPEEERRDTYLEIRVPGSDGERVVTTIEVLSLTNKSPGLRGRSLYQQKQREVLDSDIHLVEIDLLRGGTHATAVLLDRLREKAPPFDYHVCLHHFDRPEEYQAYTFTLRERLPKVPIPLLPGDGAVTVDLQAVFDRCYDTGPYLRRVRYDPARVVPPLRPEQAEWLRGVLRDKGLLTA
jgi:hypothetical protein